MESTEMHLRAITAAPSIGLWARNLQTDQVWYSPGWKALLGYADHELNNDQETWKSRVHTEDLPAVNKAIAQYLAQREAPYQCEYRLLHKDGYYRWIRASGQIQHDTQGEWFAGAHTDITDIKELETFYTQILDTVPCFVFVKDSDLRFQFVNNALAEAYGRSKGYLMGKTDREVGLCSAQVDQYEKGDREVLAQRKELRILREAFTDSTRTPITLETRKLPLQIKRHLNRPNEWGILGVATDITQLETERKALESERTFITYLMEHVPDGIFLKDKDGRYTRVNRALADALNIDDPKSMLGRTARELLPAAYAEMVEAEDAEVLSGKTITAQVRRIAGPGKTVFRLISKVPVRDEQGNVTQIVGISQDLTHVKGLQAIANQQKELIERAFDSMPQCIFIKDRQSRFTWANRAFLNHHNLTAISQLINQTDFYLWPGDCAIAAQYQRDDDDVMQSDKERLRYKEVQPWVGSAKRILETTKIPLHDGNANVIGLFGFFEDITEREDRNELQKALEGRFDLDARLHLILQRITEFNFDRARLYLLSLDGKMLYGRAQIGGGIVEPFSDLTFAVADDPCAELVLKSRTIHLFNAADVIQHPKVLGTVDKVNLQEWVQVPLVASNALIGMITVDNRKTMRPIEQVQLARLNDFASQAAQIIHLYNQFETLQERATQLDSLCAIDEQVAAVNDITQMCELVVKAVCSFTGAVSGHIRLIEEETNPPKVVMRAGLGTYAETAPTELDLSDTNSASIQCLCNREPFIVLDAAQDPGYIRFLRSNHLSPTQRQSLLTIKSFGSFPMHVGSHLTIGTLSLQSDKSDFFTAPVRQLVATVARHVAIVLRNSELLAQKSRQTKHLKALRAVERQLAHKQLELPALLQEVATQFVTLTEALCCMVYLKDGSRLVKRAHTAGTLGEHSAPRFLDLFDSAHANLTTVKAMHTRTEQIISFTTANAFVDSILRIPSQARRIGAAELEALGTVKAVLSVPLLFTSETTTESIGTITAFFGEASGITRDTRSLASDFGLRAAVAVHNAQLVDSHNRLRGFSHQLLMPLNNIGNYLGRIKRRLGQTDPKCVDWLQILEYQNQQFIRVVQDLRTFLKQDELHCEPKVLNIATLLRNLVELFSIEAKTRGCEIELTATETMEIKCDENWLFQVIGNLLHNAMFYCDEGNKISVSVDVRGEQVVIDVADRGWGMSSAERESLFKEGYRGERAREEYPQGRGIGLFISQLLITKMGGSLRCNSAEGHGTTFSVILQPQY